MLLMLDIDFKTLKEDTLKIFVSPGRQKITWEEPC